MRTHIVAQVSMTFVVNIKAKGKIHLGSHDSTKEKFRVKCGWMITKGTSLVFDATHIKYGTLCRKCFKDEKRLDGNDEDITQFDDS